MDATSTPDKIEQAGSRYLLKFYRAEFGISLDKLQFMRFTRKVTTCTATIDPKPLPPSSAAEAHHIERIYNQVQTWLGRGLDPVDLGWVLQENKSASLK